ncbi:O-linked N-acetylglucosamine transferase, SPINDLY family protein [Candidatus Pelagibacter sp. HIMB1493]|uniref:O-linked N-acetylglucosamine transferase, SPINDLY family protein n=1 Tax=Candidatus Pelagibacter sp. HIMB1493 TaxID=3413334 RepID=UPI003F8686D6
MLKKKLNISELFNQKKYNEIIDVVENKIDKKDINSQLLNILGVCKLLKNGNSKNNLIEAIKVFREAYLKESLSIHTIGAFNNFVNSSVNLYDMDVSERNRSHCKENFYEAINFYKKNNKHFDNNKKILLAITRIYKRFADVDNIITNLEKIMNFEQNDHLILCSYIYHNSFKYKWNQINFLENSKLFDEKLEAIPEFDLVPINQIIGKKIKVGILSSDIKGNHVVNNFLRSILENYNKNKFEVNLFLNIDIKKQDETTKLFKKLVSNSYNIKNLKDLDAINFIRKQKIDIMIDTMGLLSDNRIALYKNRIAPIQINWCGYCNTVGIKEMDFIFVDKNLIYPDEKHLYTEKIVYLPNIWNVHSGFKYERPKYPSPFIKQKYITFGSFNNFTKISEETIETWSTILKENKGSKLILKSGSSRDLNKLYERFNKYSVSNSIEFKAKTKSFKEHLHLYKQIDLSLDTFPYNGVTTSFESLWMGVPILVMKGFNFNSRCGESININLGMKKLIAKDFKNYIDIASFYASNIDKLLDLRNEVYEKLLASPLFDTKKFSKDFYRCIQTLFNEKFN